MHRGWILHFNSKIFHLTFVELYNRSQKINAWISFLFLLILYREYIQKESWMENINAHWRILTAFFSIIHMCFIIYKTNFPVLRWNKPFHLFFVGKNSRIKLSLIFYTCASIIVTTSTHQIENIHIVRFIFKRNFC